MANEPNTPISIEKMEQRHIVATIQDILPILKAYQSAEGADNVEFVIQGANEDGSIDESLYNPELMQTMLYRQTRQVSVEVEEDGKTVMKRQARTFAVIVNPVPRIDVLGSTEEGRGYLAHLCATEFQHRVSRPFRDESANLAAVVTEAPHTLEQFIEGTKKDGAGSLVAAFNEAFKAMNGAIKDKAPAYKKAKINKADLRHAIQCKAFADHRFDYLEDEGLFVIIGRVFAKWAQENGHNPAIFATWERTRNEIKYSVPTADEGMGGLQDLLGDFGVTDEAPEGEATEAQEVEEQAAE